VTDYIVYRYVLYNPYATFLTQLTIDQPSKP